MTVKELIAKLVELEENVDDYIVMYNDYENGPMEVEKIEIQLRDMYVKGKRELVKTILIGD